MLSLKNVKGEKMKKGKLITVMTIMVLSFILIPIYAYAKDYDIYCYEGNSGPIYINESDKEIRLYAGGIKNFKDRMFYKLKVLKNNKQVYDEDAYNVVCRRYNYCPVDSGTKGVGKYTTNMHSTWDTGISYNGRTVYVDITKPSCSIESIEDNSDVVKITYKASDDLSRNKGCLGNVCWRGR